MKVSKREIILRELQENSSRALRELPELSESSLRASRAQKAFRELQIALRELPESSMRCPESFAKNFQRVFRKLPERAPKELPENFKRDSGELPLPKSFQRASTDIERASNELQASFFQRLPESS